MIEWDPVDLLTCFETEPEVNEDELSHRYVMERNGYRLELTLWQYDEDVHIKLFGPGQKLPLTEVWLHHCIAIRYGRDGSVESLAFKNRDYVRYESATFLSLNVRIRPEFVIDVVR
jgi:hypothetical protein